MPLWGRVVEQSDLQSCLYRLVVIVVMVIAVVVTQPWWVPDHSLTKILIPRVHTYCSLFCGICPFLILDLTEKRDTLIPSQFVWFGKWMCVGFSLNSLPWCTDWTDLLRVPTRPVAATPAWMQKPFGVQCRVQPWWSQLLQCLLRTFRLQWKESKMWVKLRPCLPVHARDVCMHLFWWCLGAVWPLSQQWVPLLPLEYQGASCVNEAWEVTVSSESFSVSHCNC